MVFCHSSLNGLRHLTDYEKHFPNKPPARKSPSQSPFPRVLRLRHLVSKVILRSRLNASPFCYLLKMRQISLHSSISINNV